MNMNENRVDASLLTETERALLPQWLAMTKRDQHPGLKSKDGMEIRMPEAIVMVLVMLIDDMRKGRACVRLTDVGT